MFIGALMAIVPLRQLLKKDPKQGADGPFFVHVRLMRLLWLQAL